MDTPLCLYATTTVKHRYCNCIVRGCSRVGSAHQGAEVNNLIFYVILDVEESCNENRPVYAIAGPFKPPKGYRPALTKSCFPVPRTVKGDISVKGKF